MTFSRILITGHRGFLGRHFWAHLAAGADYMVGVDLKTGDDCREFFYDDETRFDLVLHCAAMIGGREGIDGNAAMLGAVNQQLDGALFEWALRARPRRVVYFSSSAAYPVGLQHGTSVRRLREDDINAASMSPPDNSYGGAKLAGEALARLAREAGVPVTVVRPFSSYGSDQDDDYPFPSFIKRALRHDLPFDVWGDGTQTRDWIHVDDLVRAVLTLVELGHDGPVNIGTGVGTSMDDLARMCMGETGYAGLIRHLEEKPSGSSYRVADVTLLRTMYEPKIDLREGVRRALQETSVT